MTQDSPTAERLADASPAIDRVDEDELLPQLVAHLREHRSRLREEWANRIHGAHLLEAMTPQETTDGRRVCRVGLEVRNAFGRTARVVRTIEIPAEQMPEERR